MGYIFLIILNIKTRTNYQDNVKAVLMLSIVLQRHPLKLTCSPASPDLSCPKNSALFLLKDSLTALHSFCWDIYVNRNFVNFTRTVFACYWCQTWYISAISLVPCPHLLFRHRRSNSYHRCCYKLCLVWGSKQSEVRIRTLIDQRESSLLSTGLISIKLQTNKI